MNISLFIQSKPAAALEQDVALNQAKKLLAEGKHVVQIFFYYEGVLHAKSPYAEAWQVLFPDLTFSVCSQYAEKYSLAHMPPQFELQGLVSFFAKHTQMASQLVQV